MQMNKCREPWTQDREVQWMCSGRCEGGSACQRRLCRRRECQQASPDTLLLCRNRGSVLQMWLCPFRCARQCSCCSRSTRTYHSSQAKSHPPDLSCQFLCMSLPQKPFLWKPPPSNSVQSDHFYTEPGVCIQICLGDRDMAAQILTLWPVCHLQTGWRFSLLCLGLEWVHRHLQEGKVHNLGETLL